MPMFDTRLRLAALLVVLAFSLFACTNATPGGDSTTGTSVTVNVVDTGGYPVNGQAAVQIGSGSWTSIVPSAVGTYSFVVPADETRYGFAVNCPSGLQASSTKVVGFQATTEEVTELLATCPRTFVGSTTTVEGTFNANALGANTVVIRSDRDAYGGPPATPSGPFGPIVTTGGPGRTLIAAAANTSGDLIALKALRDLDLTSATTVNVTLGLEDVVSGFATADFSSTVPPGYSPVVVSSVVFDADIALNAVFESTSAPTTVPVVPNLAPGDTHMLVSAAANNDLPYLQVATVAMADDLSMANLDLPAPYASPPFLVEAALPTVAGIPTLPDATGALGYALGYQWEGIPAHPPYTNLSSDGNMLLFLTSGWFGDASEYTVPDFTGLPGFAGAKPYAGEEATWTLATLVSTMPVTQLLGLPAFPNGWNTGLSGLMSTPVVEGTRTQYQRISDVFTVP